MAWVGAAIGAGAGILGDAISSAGQAGANQMSETIAMQEMGWEQDMSNTAMQRRVQDLQKAGLNPMLAVSQGGASVPGAVMPSIQNPDAAYGNLGNQISSAISAGSEQAQVQSRISANVASANQADAMAAKANVDAAKTAGADTDYTKSLTSEAQTRQVLNVAQAEAARASASLSSAQVQQVDASLPKIKAEIASLGASKSLDEANAAVARLQQQLSGLNIQQFKAMSPSLIESASNAAKSSYWGVQSSWVDLQAKFADLAHAQSDSKMWENNPGLSYVNAVMNWFHLGANIGGK